MPWMERPAAVYARYEVVLHCIDAPHPLHTNDPVSGASKAYDVWELRILWAFDPLKGRWESVSVKPHGYRRGVRNGPRLEIPHTTPELRTLAAGYMPDWIPDPSKAQTWLPAEAVWDEAADAVESKSPPCRNWLKTNNPYRGE